MRHGWLRTNAHGDDSFAVYHSTQRSSVEGSVVFGVRERGESKRRINQLGWERHGIERMLMIGSEANSMRYCWCGVVRVW
jgi:hypothetical protein